jgi:hypothetical protein
MENNQETSHSFRTVLKSNDPLPWFKSVRKFILGKRKPDYFTRISATLLFLLSFLFLLWHSVGYVAIAFRAIIAEMKGVDVASLLAQRGMELGFGKAQFVFHLESFHLQGVLAWLIICVSTLFLYRKRMSFLFIFLAGFVLYYFGLFTWMGWRFYQEDTTLYDRISGFVILGLNLMYAFFLRIEQRRSLL